MHVGHYISGAGHLGLIGWLLLGDVFAAEPLPFEVQSVSMITGAEFAAMTAPDPQVEAAQPEAPERVEQPAPQAEETPAPPPVPEPEPAPQPEPEPEPAPQPDPTPPEPEPVPSGARGPQPARRIGGSRAGSGPRKQWHRMPIAWQKKRWPRQIPPPRPPRKKPRPLPLMKQANPARPAGSNRPRRSHNRDHHRGQRRGARGPQPIQPPTCPQTSRPAAQVAETSQDTPDADAAAIAAAVAAAQVAPTAAAPSGPPLSAAKKKGLRVAVSSCWNVDVGGRSAETVVTVGVSLDRNGKVSGPVRMISAEGGDRASTTTAFNAARRAILRCQKEGYPLPADKYEHWKEVEMTFNPERMRVK